MDLSCIWMLQKIQILFCLCCSRNEKYQQIRSKIEFISCRTQYICLAVKMGCFPPHIIFGLQEEAVAMDKTCEF